MNQSQRAAMAAFATPKWNPVLAYLVAASIDQQTYEVRSLLACLRVFLCFLLLFSRGLARSFAAGDLPFSLRCLACSTFDQFGLSRIKSAGCGAFLPSLSLEIVFCRRTSALCTSILSRAKGKNSKIRSHVIRRIGGDWHHGSKSFGRTSFLYMDSRLCKRSGAA
jgi:hypothetical protein